MDEIDRAFDEILMGEERCHTEGYKAGMTDGEASGADEGYHLGVQQGAKLGSELGFYSGLASTWKQKLTLSSGATQKRKLKAVSKLLDLLESFPHGDPMHQDLHECLEEIRSKYKQVSQLMQVHTDKNPHDKMLSF